MKWSFVAISFLFAVVCAADERTDFGYSAPITFEQSAPVYAAPLSADAYRRAAHGDLRDLRVFNGAGEVVPFSLREPARTAESRSAPVSVPIFPLRGDVSKALDSLRVTIVRENGSVKIDTGASASRSEPILGYLVDLREVRESIVAAEFSWSDSAPEFSTAVTLSASDDLSTWRVVVGRASLVNLQYAGQHLRQSRVEFSATRAKFLRIGFSGANSVALDGLLVEPMTAPIETPRIQSESIGNASASGKEYRFDLGVRAPVDRVNVRLPLENSAVHATLLSRPTPESSWRVVAEATFFRLEREGREVENQSLQIARNTDRYWQMSLANEGGLAGGVPRLRFEWVPAQLIFVARGAPPFNVSIGNNLAANAETSLDAVVSRASTETNAKQIIPVVARIGEFAAIGGAAKLSQSPPVNWKNWVLWGVLVTAVGVLAFMARRLLREMSDKA